MGGDSDQGGGPWEGRAGNGEQGGGWAPGEGGEEMVSRAEGGPLGRAWPHTDFTLHYTPRFFGGPYVGSV